MNFSLAYKFRKQCTWGELCHRRSAINNPCFMFSQTQLRHSSFGALVGNSINIIDI